MEMAMLMMLVVVVVEMDEVVIEVGLASMVWWRWQ